METACVLSRFTTQPIGDNNAFDITSASGLFTIGDNVSIITGTALISAFSLSTGFTIDSYDYEVVTGTSVDGDPTPVAGDRSYVMFTLADNPSGYGAMGVTPPSGWVEDYAVSVTSASGTTSKAFLYHYDYTGTESTPFGPYIFTVSNIDFLSQPVDRGIAFTVSKADLSNIVVTQYVVDGRTGTFNPSALTAPADDSITFVAINSEDATLTNLDDGPPLFVAKLEDWPLCFFNPPPKVSDGATTIFDLSFNATPNASSMLQTVFYIFQIPPVDDSQVSTFEGLITGVTHVGSDTADQSITATTEDTGGGDGLVVGVGSYVVDGVASVTTSVSLGAALAIDAPTLILIPPDAALPYNQTLLYKARKIYNNYETIPVGIFVSTAGTMDPADVTDTGQAILTPYEQIGPYTVTFVETG